LRSAVQVDDLLDPIEPIAHLLTKIAKSEILRHYRIGNYNNINELLDQIAKKKGLVDTKVLVKANKKKKIDEKTESTPQKEEAARRFIRDFLNNRIQYFSKPPEVA